MPSSPEGGTLNGYGTPPVSRSGATDTALANGFTAVNGKPLSPRSTANSFSGPGAAYGSAPKPIDLTVPKMDAQLDAPPRSADAMQVDNATTASVSPAAASSTPSLSRKRSLSPGEPATDQEDERRPPPPQPSTQGQPKPPPQASAQSPLPSASAAQGGGWSASPPQGISTLSNQSASYPPQDSESREAWYGDRARHSQSLSIDEAQTAELLRSEIGMTPRSQYPSLSSNVHGGTPANLMPPTIETTAAGVQVDPRKRKRNFSNRTKTGCQTCRKRKKKCDEGKPECKNCQRGGFVCEGYTNKTAWHTKQGRTYNLQPKDYGDTGGLAPRPPQSVYTETYQPPDYPRTTYNYSDSPNRPPVAQERSSEFQAAVSAYSDSARPQQTYEEKMQHLTSRGQPIQQFAPSSSAGPRSVVQTAQMAEHALQNSSSPYQTAHHGLPSVLPTAAGVSYGSEKDKMLSGKPYAPYAAELMSEREACKAALWRFNQAQNPTMVTREERLRKFGQIIVPEANEARRTPNSKGRCGRNVEVEAPFNCSYGYNIDIADDVLIESNCFIEDAAVVHIGQGTIIGPNVSIYTNTVSATDMASRKGNRLQNIARTVTIEDNVYIGGGVVIRPGVLIKSGSVIHAGTVVDKEVPGHVEWGMKSTGDTLAGIWSR